MNPRVMTSTALLFQVRSLAQTLSEKIGLSTFVGAAPEMTTEMLAAGFVLVAPSAQKKIKKRTTPPTVSEHRMMLESKAETYLQRHVLPRFSADKMLGALGPAPEREFHKAVRKIFLDMETTVLPATLLSCLILNMRDAGKELKDLDETGEVLVDRIFKVLACDVYGAKARAQLLCQSAGLSNSEKVNLGREQTMATDLLTELSAVIGVALPPDDSRHKVAVIEEAKKKRAQDHMDRRRKL